MYSPAMIVCNSMCIILIIILIMCNYQITPYFFSILSYQTLKVRFHLCIVVFIHIFCIFVCIHFVTGLFLHWVASFLIVLYVLAWLIEHQALTKAFIIIIITTRLCIFASTCVFLWWCRVADYIILPLILLVTCMMFLLFNIYLMINPNISMPILFDY